MFRYGHNEDNKLTKVKYASGSDGISSVMLKGCVGSICSYLSTLFNCSLSLGRVPQDWKTLNITPISRVNRLSFPTSYRPIFLLSIVSKILEHIIHNSLMLHVLQHAFLSARQFGFRPGSSTQEVILSATRDWHEILERKGCVVCVFFNLSKAFDSLPLPLILE